MSLGPKTQQCLTSPCSVIERHTSIGEDDAAHWSSRFFRHINQDIVRIINIMKFFYIFSPCVKETSEIA